MTVEYKKYKRRSQEISSLRLLAILFKFRFWAYLMKVIPETRRAHLIWFLRFHCAIFLLTVKLWMNFVLI